MGVSYMSVLRLPKIKLVSRNNKLSKNRIILKKEPKVNYTLYKIGDRLYSLNDGKDDNCVPSFIMGSKYKNKNPQNQTLRNPQNQTLRNPQNQTLRNPQNQTLRNPENSQNQQNQTLQNPESISSQNTQSGFSCSIL
jgi:hypothetical protein